MGSLIKRHLAARLGVQPGSIYHCSIMPCYDKKLEASREDFNLPGAPCVALQSCPAQDHMWLAAEKMLESICSRAHSKHGDTGAGHTRVKGTPFSC